MIGSVDPFAASGKQRFARLCCLLGNAVVFLVHLDHDARHRLCVPADILHVLIGHRFGMLIEQFTAARDRDRLRPRIRTFDVLHGHPCELDADVVMPLECAPRAPTWCRRAETMSVDVA